MTLFALLPFLGGSAAQPPRASVVLAAEASGAPAAPRATSLPVSAPAPTSGSLSAVSGAIGGGLFMFPDLAMSPGIVPALSPLVAQSETFIRPVAGPETSPFGPRVHPLLGVPMFHTGLDLSAACGTPIRAAASGKVVYAQVSPSWGARTIIQHSDSLKTAYGHQSKFLVKEGDVVKQGDIIGLVGTTGWSTGCHLHFDVILNDRYVDPAPYLGLPSSHAPSIPFRATPHVVNDERGVPVSLVEDGDAPLPSPTTTTSTSPKPGPTTGTPSPTSDPSTGTPSPTTSVPTTSVPTTTVPTTTDPATSTPPPTTSDPTTTDPTTAPTTSTPPPTTSAATSDPTTSSPTTTTQAAAPADSTSSSTAAAPTSEPTSQPSATTSADPAPAPTGTGGSAGSTDASATTATSEPTTTP